MAQQTVVETPEFIKRASAVGMSDEDRMDVIDQLAANPEAGISLGGGLRKVRGGKARQRKEWRLPCSPLLPRTGHAAILADGVC